MTISHDEINFDGIVGLTHNYGGLSYGNLPSMQNKFSESNPKAAALQGLEKMKFLNQLGIKQAVLPPQERPHLPTLRSLGFSGTDHEVIAKAQQKAPEILEACSSATAMWTANSATVIPSIDSIDQHVHFIPANLSALFHRSLEADMTSRILRKIFDNSVFFTHHDPLPRGNFFSDEGAANHTRFCNKYSGPGIHLFNFGRYSFRETVLAPKRFPARQTFEASDALARLAQIFPDHLLFAQQNPLAIDAGVFHNDVISVGNRNVFLYHEKAFVDTPLMIEFIREKVALICDTEMIFVKVREEEMSLEDVVKSYLFNSQLISKDDTHMFLLAPEECRENEAAQRVLKEILSDSKNPINEIHYFDLRQSMRNGGGPACLRLRVVLNKQELEAMHQPVLFTERLYSILKDWIEKYYRDRLKPADLADPKLLEESHQALDELTKILELGKIYDFQRE